MKRGTLALVFFIVVFIALPFSGAEILIDQPSEIYSLGDKLSLGVLLKPGKAVNDFFSLSLHCSNSGANGSLSKTLIFMSPFSLGPEEEKKVDIDFSINKKILNGLTGECYLEGTFGEDVAKSQGFEISDEIEIDFELDDKKYSPGEQVNISGEAFLKNGEAVSGYIEISIDSLDVKTTRAIENGFFSFVFALPKTSSPGEKEVSVSVYETDGSEKTNHGSSTTSFSVKELLSEIEIFVNSHEIDPGEKILYKVEAYDQAGNSIPREASVSIYSAKGSLILEKITKTGEEIEHMTEGNYTPGYLKIVAEVEDLEKDKLIYVAEKQVADLTIVNNTLVVTNTGNVRYVKSIEIKIGEKAIIKDVDLDVGEKKIFRLYAPDGEYSVFARDGISEISSNSVSLTGKAIDVGELGGINSVFFIVLAIILLILIGLIYLLYRYRKIRRSGGLKEPVKHGLTKVQDFKTKAEGSNQTSAFISGGRDQAAVISIKFGELDKNQEHVVSKVLSFAKESGAKIYVNGEYRLIVLSSKISKVKDVDSFAVKVANHITEILKAYNVKARKPVRFGIGINNGQIILENSSGELKLTAVGNMIPVAKRLSGISKGEIILPENARGRISGDIKVQKLKGTRLWEVKEIVNREKHNKFMKDFVRKQEKT